MKWLRWFKNPFFLTGIALALICLGFLTAFAIWKKTRLSELMNGSEVVETQLGKIEVARSGTGPVVLVIHGAPGGYDQGLALGKFLTDAGFEILAPSRPGYLRTPLISGILPEQQADLFAALLDKLEIPSVAVVAFGEGAASALELAKAHPEKVSRMVLLSPVLQKRSWQDIFPNSRLPGWKINATLTGDIGTWLFEERVRWNAAKGLEKALQITTTLKPFYQFSEAENAVKIPEQKQTFTELVRSTALVSRREVGIRNDMVQSVNFLDVKTYASLTLPILAVRGEMDSLTGSGDVEGLMEQVKNVNLIKLAQSGYLVQVGPESAAALKQVVEFLKANP